MQFLQLLIEIKANEKAVCVIPRAPSLSQVLKKVHWNAYECAWDHLFIQKKKCALCVPGTIPVWWIQK